MIDSHLVSKINGRNALVDACVSRELANALKNNGIAVRHVADINTALKDHEIARLMAPDEVLITRDYGFFKRLGEAKAILLAPRSDTVRSGGKLTKKDKREIRKKNRLPSHIRMALREEIAKQIQSGMMAMKILWGLLWLVLPVV
jgi:uncharacterized protein YaiI (UPF0178 family)